MTDRIALTVLLMTVAAWGGAVPSDAAAAIKRCPSRAKHILVADSRAAIFEALESHGLPEYVACAHGQRVYRIGPEEISSSQGDYGVSLLRLTGTMVAYENSSITYDVNGIGSGGSELVVRNLATGHVIHRIQEGATDLVLKRDGAIAWLGGDRETPAGPMSAVRIADTTGLRVVREGPAIDGFSLALSENTVYWTNAGRAESSEIR